MFYIVRYNPIIPPAERTQEKYNPVYQVHSMADGFIVEALSEAEAVEKVVSSGYTGGGQRNWLVSKLTPVEVEVRATETI